MERHSWAGPKNASQNSRNSGPKGSASQIAKKLGSVTRNAVIGKVHRLGLSGRATPSRPVKRPPRLARPKPQQQQLPRQASAAPVARGGNALAIRAEPTHHHITEAEANIVPQRLPNGDMVTVLTVKDSMCKWPIGDPSSREFSFCGRRASEGVYCVEHARVAYQPQVRKAGKDGASELARSLRRYI